MTRASKFAFAIGLSVHCMIGGVAVVRAQGAGVPAEPQADVSAPPPQNSAAQRSAQNGGADEPTTPGSEGTLEGSSGQKDLDTYKEAIEAGLREFRAGNWPEAIQLFEVAHEANPNARTLRGLGHAHFENRSYVKAAHFLEQALEHPRRPLTARQRRETKRILARAERFIVRFDVMVTPEDAEILIDGFPATFDTEGRVLFDPGQRYVSVQSEGYRSYNQSLQVDPGSGGVLRVDLVPKPEPTPVVEVPDPVDVPASTVTSAEYLPPQSPLNVPWPAWVLGGGGAVLLTAAALTGLRAASIHRSLEEDCEQTCPANVDDRASTGRTFKTATNVLLATGGLSLAVGVAWWLIAWQDEPSPDTLAGFSCTDQGCAASVTGSF